MAGKNVNSFFETWQVQDGDPKRNFVPAMTRRMSSQTEGPATQGKEIIINRIRSRLFLWVKQDLRDYMR